MFYKTIEIKVVLDGITYSVTRKISHAMALIEGSGLNKLMIEELTKGFERVKSDIELDLNKDIK